MRFIEITRRTDVGIGDNQSVDPAFGDQIREAAHLERSVVSSVRSTTRPASRARLKAPRITSAKTGFRNEATTSPTAPALDRRSARAAAFRSIAERFGNFDDPRLGGRACLLADDPVQDARNSGRMERYGSGDVLDLDCTGRTDAAWRVLVDRIHVR